VGGLGPGPPAPPLKSGPGGIKRIWCPPVRPSVCPIPLIHKGSSFGVMVILTYTYNIWENLRRKSNLSAIVVVRQLKCPENIFQA